MAYANFVMVIGVAFFGYVLSNVASLLARLDSARENYMSNLDRVEAYMRYNNIPTELRLKVREYLRYLWESRKGYDDVEVLEQLPPKLRCDISMEINRHIIEKVPLLSGADEEVLNEIVMAFNSQVRTPGEYLFKFGDEGDAMYFIQKGSIDIVSSENQILVTLEGGAFFGEMAQLSSSPRNASARAATYCDIFVLSQQSFSQILSKNPKFANQVKKIAEERLAANQKKSS